ncbi:hypothetical protein BH11BAC2_BH11BAC2_15660 [soil metagenome]
MKNSILKKHFILLLFLVAFGGNSFAQKKVENKINPDNFYTFLVPKQKVYYLSEAEIEIILRGELKGLGMTLKNYHCDFLIIGKEKSFIDKDKHGKVIAWIEGYPALHGIFLEEGKLSTRPEIKLNCQVDTAAFKCKESFDPIDFPYLTINQSRYWYQQKNGNQHENIVSRTEIVAILRSDIKKLVETVTKR